MNAFLGVTWLHPLIENAVIGAGISYQVKSEYQPLADISDKYTPSNEVSLTAGVDIKLSETQTLQETSPGYFTEVINLTAKKFFLPATG